MEFEMETRVLIHYDYGYKGTFIIKDNPDAPQYGFYLTSIEDECKNTIHLPIELLNPLILALQKYKNNKEL